MFVVIERLVCLASIHGKLVSTEGGGTVSAGLPILETKSPQPFLFGESIIERTMQYIKNRTECIDNTFLETERRIAIPSISKTGSAYLRQCVTRRCQTRKLTGPNLLLIIYGYKKLFLVKIRLYF